jgi:hypothetical protein
MSDSLQQSLLQGDPGSSSSTAPYVAAPAEEVQINTVSDLEYVLRKAACYVDDAKSLRPTDHRFDEPALSLYLWYHNRWVTFFFRCVVACHLLLGYVEAPAYLTGFPEWASIIFEVLFCCIYVYELSICYRTVAWAPFWTNNGWNKVLVGVLVLHFLDWLCYVAGVPIRWSRILRPYHLIWHFRILQSCVVNMRKTVPLVLDIIVLIFLGIFLFTLFQISFYLGQDEGAVYYPDFGDGMWNTIVLLTNANFPDVMVPAYRKDLYYGLPFIFFLVVFMYILMSLVLASVYDVYKDYLMVDVKQQIQTRKDALSSAFHLCVGIAKKKAELEARLANETSQGNSDAASNVRQAPPGSPEEVMDFQDFKLLLSVLRPHYSVPKVRLLFRALDVNESGVLALSEFFILVEMLNLVIRERGRRKHFIARHIPTIYFSKPSMLIVSAVKSKYFAYVSDAIIVTNVIYNIVILQLQLDRKVKQRPLEIDAAYAGVFALEIILRIYSTGFKRFWDDAWNRFDILLTFVTLVAFIAYPFGVVRRDTLQTLVLLRLLRLLRVIEAFSRWEVIIDTGASLIPAMVSYASIQLCIFYSFAMLGMAFFAGVIKRDDPKLQASDYGQAEYYDFNFNTLANSFGTLFCLMVVNNWQVIVDGFTVTTTKWARTYFIFFWLIAVVFALDIVVAFIIDAYQRQKELHDSEEETLVQQRIAQVIDISVHQSMSPAKFEEVRRTSERGDTRPRWVIRKKRKAAEILHQMFSEEIKAELARELGNNVDAAKVNRALSARIVEPVMPGLRKRASMSAAPLDEDPVRRDGIDADSDDASEGGESTAEAFDMDVDEPASRST